MFLQILVGLVLVVFVIVLVASRRPDSFRVERSIHVAAAPEKVSGLVDAFPRWREWSPWEDVDPDLVRSYGAIERGVGATYEWSGKKAGAGRMEILEDLPGERIAIKLDFTRPFEAHNLAEFAFTKEGDGTKVVWTMSGPSPLLSKVMGLFLDMDSLIGKDFEKGLATLKIRAEG